MRSLFGRPDRRRRSTMVVATVSFAAVAFWLATNASVTAASGQYKPGLVVKSADVSRDGAEVKVTGTASCSPAFSGSMIVAVFQGDNAAWSDVISGAECDTKTTRFSAIATIVPFSGPLSKGPASVSVSYASLNTQVDVDLK